MQYGANLVRVSVPRRCLGNPKWVHVGIGTLEDDRQLDSSSTTPTPTARSVRRRSGDRASIASLRKVHPVYDPFDPTFQDDPYPAYAALREHDPVHHHAKTHQAPAYWALTRFADVWDAVRRPEDFSSAQGLTFYPDEIGQLGLAPTIVMLDPPVQTQLRGLVGKGFTPRRVAALEDDIRTFVRSLLADFGPGTDLHRDFSSRIPTFVLAELLGVPDADRDAVRPVGLDPDRPAGRCPLCVGQCADAPWPAPRPSRRCSSTSPASSRSAGRTRRTT